MSYNALEESHSKLAKEYFIHGYFEESHSKLAKEYFMHGYFRVKTLVTSKVSCIRRKRGQIKGLQDNNKSMVIFFLKRRKVVR